MKQREQNIESAESTSSGLYCWITGKNDTNMFAKGANWGTIPSLYDATGGVSVLEMFHDKIIKSMT